MDKRSSFFLLGGVVGASCFATYLSVHPKRPFVPSPATFTGRSSELKETVVVPTLDTPLAKGKSAIWCSSFGLAWEKLKNEVVKQPVLVDGAQQVADRLNAVTNPEGDLPAGSYYANAGLLKDGIISKIQGDMAREFPWAPKPTFRSNGQVGAVAYAFLSATTRFTIPFFDDKKPLAFKSSSGQKTGLRAFGIREDDLSGVRDLRAQTAVLYTEFAIGPPEGMSGEYIIDPCRTSDDTQIILASIKPKITLSESVTYVDGKIAEWAKRVPDPKPIALNDTLLIPNLSWRIMHPMRELEGKIIKNGPISGLPIIQADQMISFNLDRSGAALESEAKILVASAPAHYHFDHPFLIIMKKRGAAKPFFVMWVDNAELLTTF